MTKSRRQLSIYGVIGTLVLLLLSASSAGDLFRHRTVLPFLFHLRDQIMPAPVIADRLKIFVLDDATVGFLGGRLDLSLSEWADVIVSIANRRPQAILIDKLFDGPRSADEVTEFNKRLQGIKASVHIGSFAVREKIPWRSTIPASVPETFFQKYYAGTDGYAVGRLLPVEPSYLYGAPALLLESFRISHIMYEEDGYIAPLLRPAANIAVPHLGIAPFSPEVHADSLTVNGRDLQLNGDGKILVNFMPIGHLIKRTFNMIELIRRSKNGKPVSVVNEGDVVLILPAMYTGNTDWRPSPAGIIQGGFIIASVVNSVLTQNWLSEFRTPYLSPFLGLVLGVLTGYLFNGLVLYLVIFAISLASVLAGVLLFLLAGIWADWAFFLIGMHLASSVVTIYRFWHSRLEEFRYKHELQTASLVQRSFFQKEHVSFPGVAISSFYRPASECCGDWWGHYQIDRENLSIVIGDAIGHGTPAALVTAMTYSVFSTLGSLVEKSPEIMLDPKQLLGKINEIIYCALKSEFTMTCAALTINNTTHMLTVANAGHIAPIIVPADPDDERLANSRHIGSENKLRYFNLRSMGNPLGYDLKLTSTTARTDLKHGDKVILVTDGIYECSNSKGAQYSRRKFLASVNRHADLPLEEFRTAVVSDSFSFFAESQPDDDITCVVFEYRYSRVS